MYVEVTLTGTRPLLMHADTTVDTLHPLAVEAKRISAKKTNKTDEDIERLKQIDFEAGLYWDEEEGPYIPVWNVIKSFQAGAAKERNGKKLLEAVTDISTGIAPLIYDGPRDIAGLYKKRFYDARSVKVGQSRVIRVRPSFPEWALSVLLELDTSILDLEDFIRHAEYAGRSIGIGDYRQRFGRYTVDVEEVEVEL